MIQLFIDNGEYKVNWVVFSDGALTCKIDNLPPAARYISVSVDPSTPCSAVIEELSLVMSVLSKINVIGNDTLLNLPYLPYARADRVFENGNPFPLEVFLRKLLSLKFDHIYVKDVHNMEVVSPIVEWYAPDISFEEDSQLDCYKVSIPYNDNQKYDYVIAPDKGATKKASSIGDYLKVHTLYASKTRDISTGQITSFDIPTGIDFTGKKVLIPDDIFDGGGTFIGLAKALKEAGASEVHLYITHMIAAKGLSDMRGVVDKIYCYHTVGSYINRHNILDFNFGK